MLILDDLSSHLSKREVSFKVEIFMFCRKKEKIIFYFRRWKERKREKDESARIRVLREQTIPGFSRSVSRGNREREFPKWSRERDCGNGNNFFFREREHGNGKTF